MALKNLVIVAALISGTFAKVSDLQDFRDYGNTSAPGSVKTSKWPQIMNNPTHQKSFAIAGFNTSAKYPGKAIDGWTVSVAVQTALPVKDDLDDSKDDGVFAASVYRLNSPKDLVGGEIKADGTYKPDKSWDMTIAAYSFDTGKLKQLNKDDGSCKTVLTDSCIQRIKEDGDPDGKCIPSSNRVINFPVTYKSVSNGAYNGSEILAFASDVTKKADAGSIEAVGTAVSMFMIRWGEATKDGQVYDKAHTELVCPKVINWTGASLKSSGAQNQASAGLAIIALVSLVTAFLSL